MHGPPKDIVLQQLYRDVILSPSQVFEEVKKLFQGL